jgi:hypothetical protein
MYLKEVECEGVDWIKLGEDRIHWCSSVNMIISGQIPWKTVISSLSEQLSEEITCNMELVKSNYYLTEQFGTG